MCSGLLVMFPSYMGHFFKGNFVLIPDCFVPALTVLHCPDAGESVRQWLCILQDSDSLFYYKKGQLWKARLNHSFHFLMGFG